MYWKPHTIKRRLSSRRRPPSADNADDTTELLFSSTRRLNHVHGVQTRNTRSVVSLLTGCDAAPPESGKTSTALTPRDTLITMLS